MKVQREVFKVDPSLRRMGLLATTLYYVEDGSYSAYGHTVTEAVLDIRRQRNDPEMRRWFAQQHHCRPFVVPLIQEAL